ncbi:hypothetical protein GOP47_0008912 [Adiantum capillus-veneris]|uniref:Glycosyl transferase family 1 domain-containing protein n=1 Tax=Adiantum capillus-veneris TaxID=13818 RepID=A0A9D4V011_ADICA|nr:hypothetical protein GOP47_0008912 [Adiantum capillus-veneris]
MLSRRSRQALHPTLRLLASGGRQWARDAGQLALYRILGGLFLVLLLFSRAVMPPQTVHPIYQPLQIDKSESSLKLLIITLEFKKGTFSGNGVYAQSIARSLAHRGNEVLVISGKPVKHVDRGKIVDNMKPMNMEAGNMLINQTKDGQNLSPVSSEAVSNVQLSKDSNLGLYELEVEVEESGWGRLDWKCPWQSFAQGIGVYTEFVVEFSPSWALVVDWSAVPAFESLSQVARLQWRMAFLNFRIYTVSEYQGENGEVEKLFYKDMESKAVSMASAVSALSSRDAHILATQLGAGIRDGVVPKPHFPPLREDLRALALSAKVTSEGFQSTEEWLSGRVFLTCCVRLSPEKNTELFASMIEILAAFLRKQQVVPFLCGGAKGGSPYAERIKSRVKAVMPEAIIHEGFMGASDLANLYSQTLLNFHPCIYDAYGMTIVEAAAFASPSIVHVGSGGAVGAAEFLDPSQDQVFALDLTATAPIIAGNIKKVFLNRNLLAKIGQTSSRRSLSWNEDANAGQLIGILETAPIFAKQSNTEQGISLTTKL